MTRKISIYVIIPEIYRKINFLIPESMPIVTAQKLIIRMINQTEKISLESTNYQMLSTIKGMIIPPTYSLKQAGVIDGSTLMLMKIKEQ